MRLFPAEGFEKELQRRGCNKVGSHGFGVEWQAPNKRSFLVPHPEELIDGTVEAYPDWMLDDLIEKHNLPAAPDDDTA